MYGRAVVDHGATPAQGSLGWLREQGVAAVPKATGEVHIRENLKSLAIELGAADLAAIDGIGREERLVDPAFAPW